ncbi:MAG: hypothetical protein DI527_09775 [Chelatococcus sp.]|nr:MAG: hypothetical protein DI527_09775 [Chelatococcus sp.]
MIILKRLLTYGVGPGAVEIPVTVDPPVKGEQDWRCAYEIGWPGEPRRGFGYGVDATQAVLLALHGIGADLYTSDYHRSGLLRWERAGGGYGYPVPRTIRDLLVGDDAASYG